MGTYVLKGFLGNLKDFKLVFAFAFALSQMGHY